jgi:hypothetical protein
MGVQSISTAQVNELIRVFHMMERRLDNVERDVAIIKDSVGNATLIRTEKTWKAQIYICRLVNPQYLALTQRDYRNVPPDAAILFIGKTKPDGNIHKIRISHYAGKWKMLPQDYEVLATFGTDAPAEIENTLLQHPLPDCIRLVSIDENQKSKTFLAAMHGAERQYQRFTDKYYTYQTARFLLSDIRGQLPLWEDAS